MNEVLNDVVELTKRLIRTPSESQNSNAAIMDCIESILVSFGFAIERLVYTDHLDVDKVCLVARTGPGTGGLGFFAHSDTVPGMPEYWSPYEPQIDGDRLVGRGSCDMKGPIAAVLVAVSRIPFDRLEAPLYVVVSADEEMSYTGAYEIAAKSETLKAGWPTSGVVIEPTQMRPVHAHKGGIRIKVAANGVAAHTSTGNGVSANFIIAPFLAEMSQLAELFRKEKRYQNDEFTPPTNGFNMVVNDGGCAPNVTAERTVCTMSLRPMPNDSHEEAVALIHASAEKYGLDFAAVEFPVVYTDPNSAIVRAAIEVTGVANSETVPFGTEAAIYKEFTELVILGPGNIAQAHTVGEYICIDELSDSVDVYERLIRQFCITQ